MFYVHELTITANTTQDTPVEELITLTHGVITHVEVEFPPGCSGLVRAYINHALHQIWPTNPEGKFRTDGRPIVWSEYYELFTQPYQVTIGGWNTDDTYDHVVIFRFEVTPREVAERAKVQTGLLGAVKAMLKV